MNDVRVSRTQKLLPLWGSCVTSPPWLHSAIGGPIPSKVEVQLFPSSFSPTVFPVFSGVPHLGTLFCPESPQAPGQGLYLERYTQGTMDGLQRESLNLSARVEVNVNIAILWGLGPIHKGPHRQKGYGHPLQTLPSSTPLSKCPDCCPFPGIPVS